MYNDSFCFPAWSLKKLDGILGTVADDTEEV